MSGLSATIAKHMWVRAFAPWRGAGDCPAHWHSFVIKKFNYDMAHIHVGRERVPIVVADTHLIKRTRRQPNLTDGWQASSKRAHARLTREEKRTQFHLEWVLACLTCPTSICSFFFFSLLHTVSQCAKCTQSIFIYMVLHDDLGGRTIALTIRTFFVTFNSDWHLFIWCSIRNRLCVRVRARLLLRECRPVQTLIHALPYKPDTYCNLCANETESSAWEPTRSLYVLVFFPCTLQYKRSAAFIYWVFGWFWISIEASKLISRPP